MPFMKNKQLIAGKLEDLMKWKATNSDIENHPDDKVYPIKRLPTKKPIVTNEIPEFCNGILVGSHTGSGNGDYPVIALGDGHYCCITEPEDDLMSLMASGFVFCPRLPLNGLFEDDNNRNLVCNSTTPVMGFGWIKNIMLRYEGDYYEYNVYGFWVYAGDNDDIGFWGITPRGRTVRARSHNGVDWEGEFIENENI